MIGERDDGAEAIEIDVTSPDQINLQFMEEQGTAQVTETYSKQVYLLSGCTIIMS